MSKRAIGMSPAFAGFIALTGIVLSAGPARAGEECLAAPNASAPTGSHWYYHLDRSTQRKCWYVRSEDRQVDAEKSTTATETDATDKRTRHSRQTELAHTRPAAASDQIEAQAPVLERPEPTAVATPTLGAADEQPAPPAPLPSPAASNPGTSASMVENSGPASAVSVNEDASGAESQHTTADVALAASSSQTAVHQADAARKSAAEPARFPPMRVLLLILAALALTGVLAFAVVPSRLRRQIFAGRWSPRSAAIAELNRPAPQLDIPDEARRNLRQVLQTLEAQLRGDVELEEALAQSRSRKPGGGANLIAPAGTASELLRFAQ